MYTQCPHCQTTFQVNSAQLKAAQGMVRCGSCHRIFNSLPRLIEKNQKAKKVEDKEPNFPVVESEEIFEEIEINHEAPKDDRPFLAKAKEMRKQASSAQSKSPRSSRSTGNLERNPVTTASIAKAKVAAIAKQNKTLKETPAPKSPRLKSPQLAGTTTASRVKEKLQQAKSRLRRQVTPQPEPFINEETIAGTELVNASAADVTHFDLNSNMPRFPEMGMQAPSAAPQKPKFYKSSAGIWSVSIIGLLLLLLVQYMYFFREDFVQIGPFRSLYSGVCSLVGCSLPLVDDPSKIKVVTDIRTHPDNAGALVINAILTNRHEMPQYYPMLELVLSNGSKTVVREFHPIEYMGKHVDLARGIEFKKTVPVKLEIVDPFPNTDKVRFELNLRSSQTAK